MLLTGAFSYHLLDVEADSVLSRPSATHPIPTRSFLYIVHMRRRLGVELMRPRIRLHLIDQAGACSLRLRQHACLRLVELVLTHLALI